MFVSHCKVDTSELLKYPKQTSKRSQKRKKGENSDKVSDVNNEDRFHPVKCDECNTVVAVYDDDEVYHFFNVLASYWWTATETYRIFNSITSAKENELG